MESIPNYSYPFIRQSKIHLKSYQEASFTLLRLKVSYSHDPFQQESLEESTFYFLSCLSRAR